MIETLNRLAAGLESLPKLPKNCSIHMTCGVEHGCIVLLDPEVFDALDIDDSVVEYMRPNLGPTNHPIGKHFDIGTVRVMTVYNVHDTDKVVRRSLDNEEHF